MKLLFAADLHLDPLIWKDLPDVRGDAHDSWKQIAAAAVDRKVDAVILGGDVFDAHPPSESVRCFLEGVWGLKEKGIPILAIQGQHGYDRRLAWSSLDPYVQDLNASAYVTVPLTAVDAEFRIAGIDNLPPAQLKERLSTLRPEVNVLVVHQMIKGMVPSFGGREIWNMDPDWVPSHIKLVLAGDYHSPVEATFRGIKFKYNGSTVLRKIDEPDDKFFHIIHDDFSIESVQLGTRPVKRFLLLKDKLTEDDSKQLAEELKARQGGSVVYMKHNSKIPGLEDFCKSSNPKLHYIFKTITVRDEIVVNATASPADITLRGCLDRLLDREKSPFLYDLICALLDAESPADTIAAFRQKFLGRWNDVDVQTAEDPKFLPDQES